MTNPPAVPFRKALLVRQRYLSPRLLRSLTSDQLENWGRYKTLDEFNCFLTTSGFDLKTQCITSQSLGRWAKALGMKTGRRRKIYTFDEVEQFDDFFRAIHLLGMSLEQYDTLVIRKGKKLHSFLTNSH
jgi:hypothetical protein